MLLGIDIGTQSLKVVVTGDRFVVLGRAQVSYAVDIPRPGWAQQDPVVWLEALEEAVPAALAKAGARAGDIEAVSVAGQLDGCIAVDAHNVPMGPCLIWMDRRAAAIMPELPDDFRTRTGVVADAGHMAAKALWLLRKAVLPSPPRFHQPVSFVTEVLCGQSVWDPALASTSMVYDARGRKLAPDLLDAFGLAAEQLPRLQGAGSVAGTVSASAAVRFGLAEGTQVAVGTGDDFATPLGAGLGSPGTAVSVIGTAEVVGTVVPEFVIDDTGLLQTHAYPAGGAFIENPGWLSGGAVAWVREVLGIPSDAELDGMANTIPAGCEGLVFIPALTGAMAPVWNADARGCFYGLTPAHGASHLARAVLEGCAFAMKDCLDRACDLGAAYSDLLIIGGGAHSGVWAQMRSDLMQLPVRTVADSDRCAVGAAMLASVAAGAYGSVAEATAAVECTTTRFEPGVGEPMLAAHARYRTLFSALDGAVF